MIFRWLRHRGPIALVSTLDHIRHKRHARAALKGAQNAKVAGKADIGGPFTLIDSATNKSFSSDQLKGTWSLLYFGFTHCPDICPTTLAELAQLKAQLADTEADATRVVMLSVDPARDTPERLAQYVPYFYPDFVGVTGEFTEILSVAQRLNAPFRKVSEPDGSYQMEHSANVILMNPRGDYHGFFRAPLDIPKMRVTLRSTQYLWEH